MKHRIIMNLTVGLLLGGCQTIQASSTSHQASSEKATKTPLLQRVIGAETIEEKKSIQIDCKIYPHQVSDLDSFKVAIQKAKKEELREALHIVATIPSRAYYAFDEKEQIVLSHSHSKTVYREGPESKKLIDFLNQKCAQ